MRETCKKCGSEDLLREFFNIEDGVTINQVTCKNCDYIYKESRMFLR